jgi:hypothetical protein
MMKGSTAVPVVGRPRDLKDEAPAPEAKARPEAANEGAEKVG